MASTSGTIISVVSQESLMSDQGNSHDITSCNASQEYLSDKDSIEQIFYKRLVEYDDNHTGSNRKPWTQSRIEEVIAGLKNIKVSTKKKTVDYYWMGKYEVITTATGEYLTFKKKNYMEPYIRIVPREQYFDIISEVHTACGHGGRDKILYDIKSKYYIPKKAVEIFVSVCPVCESKRSTQKSDIGPRSFLTRHLNATGDLNLIDLQSIPDGEYKWILHYQNLDSKFTILRPLKTIDAREVAYELLTIFLTLGAPFTLQSILSGDFMKNILDEFLTMWPDCKIEYKAEDNIGKSSEEIQSMLRSWMKDNDSVSWSVGCLFVQYEKNTLSHELAGKVPIETLFGRNYGLIQTKTNYDASSPAVSMLSTTESEKQISPVPEQQNINTSFNVCSDTVSTLSTHKPEDATSPIINIKQEVEVEFDNTSPDTLLSEADNNIEQKYTPPLHKSENDDFYKCQSCNSSVHVIRGIVETEEGRTIKVSCYVCKSEQEMEMPENKGFKRPAEDNIECIPKKIVVLEIGHSVIVSVPKAFQGPLNTKAIKGKIVDFRNGVYRVATKIGTMKNWFSRHDLKYCEIDYGDVLETPVTLEDTVASQPSDGQSCLKCNCKPAVNQCHNNRCLCFKNKVLCGSKCHQNLVCINT